MTGIISHFRGTYRRRKGNQMVVIVPGVDSKEKAEAYIGKSVSWTAPGKKKTTILGKVSTTHGNKGALRIVFERGLPGQSLGSEVKIQ